MSIASFLQGLLLVSNCLYHCAVFPYSKVAGHFTVKLDCTPPTVIRRNTSRCPFNSNRTLSPQSPSLLQRWALVNNRPPFHADVRLASAGQGYSSPLTQVYALPSPVEKAMLSSSRTIIHKRSQGVCPVRRLRLGSWCRSSIYGSNSWMKRSVLLVKALHGPRWGWQSLSEPYDRRTFLQTSAHPRKAIARSRCSSDGHISLPSYSYATSCWRRLVWFSATAQISWCWLAPYTYGIHAAKLLSALCRSTTTSVMPRYLDLDSCLQAAKLTAAAGQMAPFPFVKGVAQCVVVILEIIQVCRDFSFRQSLP